MTMPVTEIDIDGYTISIYHDRDAANPLTEWEHCAEYWIMGDRNTTEYNSGILDFDPNFTREQIKENLPAIVELFSCIESWDGHVAGTLLKGLSFIENYGRTNYSNFTDYFNDVVSHHISNTSGSEKAEFVEAILRIAGYHVITGTARGHVQSDWYDYMFCMSQDKAKSEGITDPIAYLDGVKNEFCAWAFGDVYGYQVATEGDEPFDSCWGFYGEYQSEGWNHMIEEAKSAIETEKSHQSRINRSEKITAWAKARYWNRDIAKYIVIANRAHSKYIGN